MGPSTSGGLTVAMSKLGFSSLTKSQAAFSAKVYTARLAASTVVSRLYPTLLALYTFEGSMASSQVTGFQFFSLYVLGFVLGSTIAAKDDVTTTRFTVGA